MASATEAAGRMQFSRGYRGWFLGLLVAIYACSFVDRIILSTVGQAIKVDLKLTDLQFGLLGGLAFAVFYAAFGIPIARLAERTSRVAIISICIALWSAMTALSGVSANYWQLLLFRMGVGLGEGGCGPAAQSLISDHYPPKQRASALAIFAIGVPLGSMIGAVSGGWITQTFNWRAAFFVVGLPGLVLALLTRLTLKEPPRGHSEGRPAEETAAPLTTVIGRLVGSPTIVLIILGCLLTNLSAAGINTFAASYLVRRFDMSFTSVGLLYGLVTGASGTFGILVGGFGADIAARRDPRWYAWMPAIGAALALPAFLIAFTRADAFSTAAWVFGGSVFYSFYFAPTFGVIQNLVEPRMRASAAALMLLLINICGQGLGPTFMGWLSDHRATRIFASSYVTADFQRLCPGGVAAKGAAPELASACANAAATGLQQALLAICLSFALGATCYLLASRSLRRDMSGSAFARTDA
jgi:predicted MFS family arabinose efflux permease